MSARTSPHTYTIKEAAALTGLSASTLRYYESIGVIAPISRGASSKHRLYDEDHLDQLMWVACLAATGMSVSAMPQYVANEQLGPSAAAEQIDLLSAQEQRLIREAEQIALRTRYVRLKIDYWRTVDAGDPERAELLAGEARALGMPSNDQRSRRTGLVSRAQRRTERPIKKLPKENASHACDAYAAPCCR